MDAMQLFEASEAALSDGHIDESQKLAQRLLRQLKRSAKASPVDLASAQNLLAQIAFSAGQESIGIKALQKALEALDGYKGRSEGSVRLRLQIMTQLGQSYCRLNDYDSAAECLYAALDMAERRLPRDDIDKALLLNNLGVFCRYTGRFAEGRKFYRQAMRILKKQKDPDLHFEATLFYNIGGIEHAAGRFQDAEAPARAGAALRLRLLGAEDVSYAEDLSALASILSELGKFREAENSFKKALSIFKKSYGNQHYEIAVNLGGLGLLSRARGRLPEAETYFKQALAIERKRLGPKHVEVAMSFNNLAVVYSDQGRLPLAESNFKKALAIYATVLEKDHPTLVLCLQNLLRIQHARKVLKKRGAVTKTMLKKA